VLRELAQRIENKFVISLAGGVWIASLEKVVNARFMRALTNTPSAICRAATGITRGSRSTNEDVDLARKIFGAIGVVVEIDEPQIDIVTALSGSGPAVGYKIIEALTAGGTKLGLATDVAMQLAIQTTLGAAEIMR